MARVILKGDKDKKIRNFYPNVFQDEIEEILGSVKNGDIVEVCTLDGEIIGKGYVAELTNAFVRMLTTKDVAVDKTLILEKIKRAYEKRKHLLVETNCIRIFYYEADGITGLIIDKFDKYVSVQ